MKKGISLLCAAMLIGGMMTGCANKKQENSSGTSGAAQTLKVAALESAYGAEMWQKIKTAFEQSHDGVTVELTVDKNLEDVIGAQMKAGNYPDVIHLATGRPAALTETLTKEKALTDLSGVLDMTVPGESKKVKEKIIPGFTDTLVTNPYGDGKTYLAPMFYSPCGLFYNAGLFEQKGWSVPKTWDEMWALGEKAKAEGLSLFTYPTSGYFDAFMFALLTACGGPELFNQCMTYTEGIWNTDKATEAFDIVGKLASFTQPTTVANANNENYLKNQQLLLDNQALFMPNGTWVVGEMADAPRADGFEWGFMALPAVQTDRYAYTYFEQSYIPKQAKNADLAKEFLAFLYSDKAADIFAEAGAIQPIEGMSAKLTGDNKLFYSVYDTGAKAVMGGFATTAPVEGVSMKDALFGTIDSVVSGDKTVPQWQQIVADASNKLRAAMT